MQFCILTVSKPAEHLYDQAAVQYFECMHASLRGNGSSRDTEASSLLVQPKLFLDEGKAWKRDQSRQA
ncbi:TPA: hypothetical protein ACH3X2_008479 [Trebouxia sp. C0005]